MNSSELQLSDVSYTKRDFQEVYVELLDLAKELAYKWDPTVSNESDPGVVLIKELALAIDKINYNSDKNALENFPLSVSQDRMARQLFSLLGYFPKWYRSAISNINLTYSADDIDVTDTTTITLPLFTQIKDADNDFVYTLFGDSDGNPSSVTITMDGKESPTYKAIEGSIQHLNLNGSEIIYLSNLDSDNRIYLPDYNVAQNGIFISNVVGGQPSLNFWKQVDNLYTEDLNSLVYSFGVDILNGECYVEFPQDIATLIGEGLSIYYVLSTGTEGNAPIGFLDSFYDSTVVGTLSVADASGSTSINLSSENVTITNTGLTFTGKNPETIDESYKNYKKTVGTFDTLVTLRDYNNALYMTEEVSNCVVTDRTNDIQSTYKIISETSDLINYEYAINDMDAFDLKVYALNYNDLLYSKGDYDLTFTMYSNRHASIDTGTINSNLYQLVRLLDDQKCICHDFNDIEENKICLLKNKFTINCNIIPVASVSDIQKNEIKQNISQAIYQALNARNVEFGEKIEYDTVYRIILNSDKRIKAVMLENIEYSTYAIYCEDTLNGTVWKEVCVSDQHPGYLSGYLNSDDESMYENYYTTITGSSNTSSIDNAVFISMLPTPGTYDFYSETSGGDTQWYLESSIIGPAPIPVSLEDYGIVPSSGADQLSVTVDGIYLNKFTSNMLIHGAYYMDLNSENVYVYDVASGAFNLYSDKRSQFRTEIFAKSILAGITPYLVEDGPLYQYQLVQQLAQPSTALSNIDHVTTNANIRFQFDVESTQSTVELNENETVQFSRPSLFEETTYSTYVKYVMIRNAGSQPISANTDYILGSGEQIIFLYKENDSDVQYKRDIYGPGTIICPSFLMRSDSFVQASNYGTQIPAASTSNKRSDYLSVTASDNVPSDDTLISLTATNTISIKSINQVTLTSNNNFYVITSDIIEENGISKYRMQLKETNVSGTYEYVLQQGEYFIYTNSAKTVLNILGTGTKITVVNTELTEDTIVFKNEVTATSNINTYGVAALTSIWQQIPSVGTFTVTEQEFINVLPGGEVTFYIAADNVTNLISIPQYTIYAEGSGANEGLFIYSVTSSIDVGLGTTQDDSKVIALVHDLYFNLYGDDSQHPENDALLTNPPISFVYNPEATIDGIELVGYWQFYDNSGTLRLIPNASSSGVSTLYGGHGLHYYLDFSGQIENREENSTTVQVEVLTDTSEIDVGYKSVPQDDVDLSSFDMIKYKQPDGTEGSLNLSLSEELKWNAKSYLTLDCSITEPQILREGQSITFMRAGSLPVLIEYDDSPIYLFADRPVYSIGGVNIDISSVNAEGAIETPSFYAFTVYEQPEDTTDTGRFSYDSKTGELDIILPSGLSTSITTINCYLPTGDYIIPLVNKLNLYNGEDETQTYSDPSITVSAGGSTLTTFNGTVSDFKDAGVYYIKLHIEESDGETPVSIVFTITSQDSDTVDRFITVKSLLKYVKIDASKSVLGLDELLTDLDKDKNGKPIFDYTYRVNPEQEIDNPLDSAQFFNYYHIDNKFTIAQVDGFVVRIVS